jgi:type I restriction enzyme, R subunit
VTSNFRSLARRGDADASRRPTADALSALKIARASAIWFHQSYGGAPNFRPGPFVPPAAPVDATKALRTELEALREQVRASSDNEAKALLAYQEAEAARLNPHRRKSARGFGVLQGGGRLSASSRRGLKMV